MNKKSWLLLLVIVIVASVLRFWQIGHVPISPDWDEAALGYNAYSILHTGKDEYGKFMPVVLESFGDYKPALYTYLIIPLLLILHLSILTVRLPSVLFGIATVIATFFLVKELFKRLDIALLSSFLLAVSPWHIQFSRVAFEANVGLSFNVFMALAFMKGLKKPWFLPISVLFATLSIYTYQSEKVFTPLLFVSLVILYRKELFRLSKKYLITAVLVGVLLILPMAVYIKTNPAALARAQSVSIFSQTNDLLKKNVTEVAEDRANKDYLGLLLDNRRLVFAQNVVSNYLSHFSLNWLFITGDNSRHHPPHMGLLYWWELPFILLGIYFLVFGKFDKRTKWLLFLWFFLAPVPAAITTGVPHAVRTLNFLPMYQIFTALGLISSWAVLKNKKVRYGVFGIIVVIGLFNFLYYIDQYFVQLNYFVSVDWQDGYQQLIGELKPVEHRYKQIIVSNDGLMDQSYIFFLYYLPYPPTEYQQAMLAYDRTRPTLRSFGKFQFRKLNWETEKKDPTILYLGRPSDFPKDIKPAFTSYFFSGEPAMIGVSGK